MSDDTSGGKPGQGPVFIDLTGADVSDAPSVSDADPVPEPGHTPAMAQVAAVAAARPSPLARWFWGLLGALVTFFVSLALWNAVAGLLARNPVLGWVALGLLGAFCLVLLAIAAREAAGFARLRRIDRIQTAGANALAGDDLAAARDVARQIGALYAGRQDARWGVDRLTAGAAEQFDASGVLGLAETAVLEPLDARAIREVEAAARQVATVTAIVPLALADVIAALTGNLRMIRRIAEIYGGRSGTLETWRLTRSVLSHLVATGAVAVGDDLIGSIAGGGVLSKVSRRFGEGVINGALTARVGVAAIEVCRPLAFTRTERPRVTALVRRALTGLFGSSTGPG